MIKFILIGEGQTRIHIESLIKTYNLKNIEIKNKIALEKLIGENSELIGVMILALWQALVQIEHLR